MNVHPVVDGASTSSTNPSIPSGFETQNRFLGLIEENEEEVATSQSVVEDSEIRITMPSSSYPILRSNKKLSLKSKATGMYPNGTLSTKKKNLSKSKVPNKVSANKLLEYGSLWGLDFPTLKNNRKGMFSDLAKNHDGLVIEDVNESIR